jgi:ABC-type antimicrobial peptide transport system permease subunit
VYIYPVLALLPQDRVSFLILAGALTALGLPFAIAFPPTLAAKALAVAALVAVAAGIAAAVQALRRRKD